jgi:hypothetical protein
MRPGNCDAARWLCDPEHGNLAPQLNKIWECSDGVVLETMARWSSWISRLCVGNECFNGLEKQ